MKAISKCNYSTILSCHTSTNFNIRCILSVFQVCLGGSIIDPTKLSFHSRNKGDSWGKNHANSSKENDSGLESRNDSQKQGRSITQVMPWLLPHPHQIPSCPRERNASKC